MALSLDTCFVGNVQLTKIDKIKIYEQKIIFI